MNERVTVDNFRSDPMFARIERAVAAILVNGKVVAPVDVLVKMAILAPKDLEEWRFGRVPYLERVPTWELRWRIVQHGFPRGFVVPRAADFFFEFDEALIRRRSLRTGEPIGQPIDLGPSDDKATRMATSSDGKTLVVGTERGVLLRFRVR